MKFKEYHFDVDMVIDHSVTVIGKTKIKASTHHGFRGMKLSELTHLIESNKVPKDEDVNITFHIRGVNY